MCLTKLCSLQQKKGQPSTSVVTLTVRDKAGDPTQVDVESNTQMIDFNKLLKNAGPAKETLQRLYTPEKLMEYGMGEPMITLTELEKKIAVDAKQEAEEEQKKKEDADLDLLARYRKGGVSV